ncbi:hypothetical protein LINPERPRIM_LOCUS100, partial [Linum perenne]
MRGRDRTSWFWVIQSGLLSVRRRRATTLVWKSFVVRVPGVVLEPRLLVSFSF